MDHKMVYHCCQILACSGFDCYIFSSSFALFRTSSVVIYLLPDLFFLLLPKSCFFLSVIVVFHVAVPRIVTSQWDHLEICNGAWGPGCSYLMSVSKKVFRHCLAVRRFVICISGHANPTFIE